MKKFSEVAKSEPVFEGAEYIKDKESLKGKSMEIVEFKEIESSTGKYAVVHARLNGKDISFSIGGVVYNQLKKNENELPFEASLGEEKSADGRLYYTLK